MPTAPRHTNSKGHEAAVTKNRPVAKSKATAVTIKKAK
jgi:hypothetical protein